MISLPSLLAIVTSLSLSSTVSGISIPRDVDAASLTPNNFGMLPNGTYIQDLHLHLHADVGLDLGSGPSFAKLAAGISASSAPENNTEGGYFEVSNSTATMGYLQAAPYGWYSKVTTNKTEAAVFNVDGSENGSTDAINVGIIGATDSYNWLCLALGYSSVDSDMKSDNQDNAFLTKCQDTGSAGDKPAAHKDAFSGGDQNSETAVFTYDASSGAVKTMWVDTQGNTVPTSIMYSFEYATFNIVASPDYWLSQEKTYAEVTFKYVPVA